MMIKITEKCSMGCTHCMNNASPNGSEMDFNTFKKALSFQEKYGGPFCIITGGEPTEHISWIMFVMYALSQLPHVYFTVTTNGVWMQSHFEEIENFNKSYGDRLIFQVTNDKRYYPIHIDLSLPVFNLPNVFVCDEIEHIYPQGRALDNNLEWESKGSKCFNIRAFVHQRPFMGLQDAINFLGMKGKFCTPHIDVNGNIKLGESDLCPICSNINKQEYEIITDILNFRCNLCNHVNKNLPEKYRKIIGEE